jgi:uncharacterized protein with GYD domain
MPTFICFLNWTDQGAKNAKDANKRFRASKSMAEKLGGKLLSAYVTTGQYDVVVTLDMPNVGRVIHISDTGRNRVKGLERTNERASRIHFDVDASCGRGADPLRQTRGAGLKPW